MSLTSTEAAEVQAFAPPWCNPYVDPLVFRFYICFIICWIINLILGALGTFKIISDYQSHFSFKICYLLINICFIGSPACYAFGFQSGWECWYDNHYSWMSQNMAGYNAYAIGLALLYGFWILRLYHSFKGTALHINKFTFMVLICGLILQLTTAPISSYYFLCCGWDPIAREKALNWLNVNTYSNIICSVFVLTLFIRKILQASVAVTNTEKIGGNTTAKTTEVDIQNEMMKHGHGDKKVIDKEMLALIIKYMILASIALMSTNLVSIYGFVKAAIPEWRVSMDHRVVHMFGQALDQTVNLVCLYLQFPFGQGVYGKLCGGMQDCVSSCFTTCMRLKVKGGDEMIMAEISTKTGSTTKSEENTKTDTGTVSGSNGITVQIH